MYRLERGSRKFTCPSCGTKKKFTRYIDEFGNYLDEQVGRCDRESSCGYHLTAKEHLGAFVVNRRSRNEQLNKVNGVNKMNDLNRMNIVNNMNAVNGQEHFDTIDKSFVRRSLEQMTNNNLLKFLLTFIDRELVEKAVKDYFIGATKDGRTVLWYIDRENRPRTGKIIAFPEDDHHRDKSRHPSWVHYELKKAGQLPDTFNHRLCLFGEHLLDRDKKKAVAIVEAEKTAVVASIFIPGFLWIAVGAKSWLKADKLRCFKGRKVLLYPDADAFEFWSREAMDARSLGLNIEVSRIIEETATEEERKNGFDLADYLIKGELRAQKWNEYANSYNAKVEKILADENLFASFNEMLEERMAITETEDLTLEDIRILVDYVI